MTAFLDHCKEPRNPKRPYCERCGREIKSGQLSMAAHYNYDTFEIRPGHTEEKGPWGNNIVIGNDCAKRIRLI